LHLAVRPSIELGVRVGTKVIQEGLVLGLELLALGCCRWFALKAERPDQGGEAALVTITVCRTMSQLMHQNAKHPDRIVNDRRDQNLMGVVRGSLGRPMLTDGTVLGRPGVTAGETTGNPNLIGQWMIKSRKTLRNSAMA
jgi:hypothetical protein